MPGALGHRFSNCHMKQLWFTLVCVALLPSTAPRAQDVADGALKRTNHPRLPSDTSQLWLAPDAALVARMGTGAMNEFTTAVKLEVDGNFAKALPMLEQAPMQQSTLAHYAEYYEGLAQLRLGRPADARRTFQTLAAKSPTGYLVEYTRRSEDSYGVFEEKQELIDWSEAPLDPSLFEIPRNYRPALRLPFGGVDITRPDTLPNRVQAYWEMAIGWVRSVLPRSTGR